MIYCFKITLRPQGCAGIEVWNFESYASNYYDAWKEATDFAYKHLMQKDKNWYISAIESFV